MGMSLVENRPAGPVTELPGQLTRVLVIAADARERVLINGALGEVGQEPEAVLHDRAALADHRVDEATVLILACDVDRPTEVTALRKLSRAAKGAAIIVVSPRVTATAARGTLDAGAG